MAGFVWAGAAGIIWVLFLDWGLRGRGERLPWSHGQQTFAISTVWGSAPSSLWLGGQRAEGRGQRAESRNLAILQPAPLTTNDGSVFL